MTDQEIISLFFSRSENAIAQTAKKYGKYCHTIAYHILKNHEDSEECVNDTYLKAWKTIPPQKPNYLSAYLGKITRNTALHRYAKQTAKKRGTGEFPLALDELSECIPSTENTEKTLLEEELTRMLNTFLTELTTETRNIFLRRYWYFSSIQEIARDFGMKESNVRVILFRTREKLKIFLEKEGIPV